MAGAPRHADQDDRGDMAAFPGVDVELDMPVGGDADLPGRRELVLADEGERLVALDLRVGVDRGNVDAVAVPDVEVDQEVHFGVARQHLERVGAGAPRQGVDSRADEQLVVAAAAVHPVGTLPAVDQVGAVAATQVVVAGSAEDPVEGRRGIANYGLRLAELFFE